MTNGVNGVVDFLKHELESNYNLKVIAYDENLYVVGVATTVESLDELVKTNKLQGVVADFTSEGHLNYSKDMKEFTLTDSFKDSSSEIEAHIMEQIKSDLSKGNSSLDEMIVSNNKTVTEMCSFINGVDRTGAIAKLKGYDLPKLTGSSDSLDYLSVVIESYNLILHVTDCTIFFETSNGIIKLHDANKDVDYNVLINLLSDVLDLSKNVVKSII